jgi:hypothetical protein
VPPKDDPARRTFNLDMVANGWAAQFLVFPALPQNDDLNLLHDEAKDAWTRRRGAWRRHGRKLLLGYEYRLCIKLGTATSRAKGMAGGRLPTHLHRPAHPEVGRPLRMGSRPATASNVGDDREGESWAPKARRRARAKSP